PHAARRALGAAHPPRSAVGVDRGVRRVRGRRPARPVLEWSKHSAHRWFGPADLPVLKENRAPGEYLIHDLIAKALREDSCGAG
ncbi:hypothetical protein ACWCQV_36630, partial [Streptomyces eurythermus]